MYCMYSCTYVCVCNVCIYIYTHNTHARGQDHCEGANLRVRLMTRNRVLNPNEDMILYTSTKATIGRR